MKFIPPGPFLSLSPAAAVDPGLPRPELLARLKEAEAAGLAAVRTVAAGPYRPGLGRALGAALASVREGMVGKAVQAAGLDPAQMAVVALGGLARRELAPGSDLDILILHASGAPVESFSRDFLHILWDCGLKVAASTRTVTDSLNHAREDDDFFTALLQTRLLMGAPGLLSRLERGLDRVIRARGGGLIAGWWAEARATANACLPPGKDILFAKEPHLKHAPGGLRAVHMIEWVAAIRARSRRPPAPSHLPGAADVRRLSYARDVILCLRIMLHFTLAGAEDRLAPDYQAALAASFGIEGGEADRVRSLMRHYYRQVLFIHRLLFRECERAVGRGFPGRWRKAMLFVRRDASAREGVLYAAADLAPDPREAFRALALLCSGPLLISSSLIEYFKRCARDFDEAGWRSVTAKRFTEILGLPRAATGLRALHLAGLLHRLLPALWPVRLLYSPHPAHLHPVDVHSIEAVAALEDLVAQAAPSGFPGLVREVMIAHRDRLWLVKLTLLLHDAGKGFPGDHAQNGVEIAAGTLSALGIAPQHRAAVRFFIEHHLMLSAAARRRDTSDPAVLQELADVFIFSPYPGEYLDLLLIITWADVRAAHPRNLTGYFMLTLARTYERLRERVLAGRQARPEAAPAPAAAGTEEFEAFCRDMGERYLANNDEAAIRRDYEALAALAPDGFSVAVHTYNEYLKVRFFSDDRPGLFALFCGILSRNGAAIVRADIHTWRGRVLDEFYVTHIFESESGALDGEDDVKRWESAVRRDAETFRDDLDGLGAALAALKRLTRGLGAHFRHPARVTVTPLAGNRALIEVSGRDRPALLFDLAAILAREGVAVQSALIDTTGWLVDDRFEVCLKDETRAVRDRVRAALAAAIEQVA